MNPKLLTKTSLLYFISMVVVALLLCIPGCDDSGVVEKPPVVDSNVVIYSNLSVTYYLDAINDTLYLAVDLLNGKPVQQQNPSKDMTIIDEPIGTNQNFYFRTGDIVLDVPGKSTKFNRLFSDASQNLFDTLSKIVYSGTLDSNDFTQFDTYGGGAWNYFNVPLAEKPIYSFYLRGKFLEGITTKPVYGMFYMKESQPLSEHGGGSRFIFDVKINKNGENKFVR